MLATNRRNWCFCYSRDFSVKNRRHAYCVKGVMRTVTYGFGGYDPTKPNNNIVEEYDDGIDPEPETDDDTI